MLICRQRVSAVSAMADQIKAADGIIIVTPEYNYSVPGVRKNAIDPAFPLFHMIAPLAGKPVAIQERVSGTDRWPRADHLRQSMVFLDALVLNKPEVMIQPGRGQGGRRGARATDQATREFIVGQLKAFATFVWLTRKPAPSSLALAACGAAAS